MIDERDMAAKRLVEYIKENPTSSSIILTSLQFKRNWRKLILEHMEELNIKFSSSMSHLITVEGNENKHHPTVRIMNCGSEDIRGRWVTGILLLDIFFLKATPAIKREFALMAERGKDIEWLKKNTPLSLHIETVLRPVLASNAQVWTVGYNEKISPAYLDSLLPDNR